MLFFFRKPTIKLQCFTQFEYIKNLSPISKATSYVPEWFTGMNSSYKTKDGYNASTIKKCPAAAKHITAGFIFPLWSDLFLRYSDRKLEWHYATAETFEVTSNHHPDQWRSFKNPRETAHLKLGSPWRFKTKEDIKFMWQQPYYQINNPLIDIVQGIDTFKYTHSSNINMFLDIRSPFEILLKHNTPMVQLIPLTEKRVEVENIVVSQSELMRLNNPIVSFQNTYKKLSKCPFHK